jgi:nicotinamide riboside transporter PnuC
MIKTAEWLATIGTVLALYMLSENNSAGFSIGLISNIIWMYWAHETKANGILAVNAIMLFINLNGLGIV